METFQIVFPVVFMIVLGYITKASKFFNDEGMILIKKYITSIALPVVIFGSMSIADISSKTGRIFVAMLCVLSGAMLIGFVLRKAVGGVYSKYFPFLTTVFEAGMLGYPLYTNVFGDEKLVNIVVVDIAGCVFAFAFYFGMLNLVDKQTKFSVKNLAITAIKSPCFDALLLGMLFNLTGLMEELLESDIAGTYLSVKEMITAPLTPLILVYVGYSLKLDKKLLPVCLLSAVIRFLTAILMLFVLSIALKDIVHNNKEIWAAFLIYLSCPPSFALLGFSENKDASEYFAMTVSLYVIINVVAYAAIVAWV